MKSWKCPQTATIFCSHDSEEFGSTFRLNSLKIFVIKLSSTVLACNQKWPCLNRTRTSFFLIVQIYHCAHSFKNYGKLHHWIECPYRYGIGLHVVQQQCSVGEHPLPPHSSPFRLTFPTTWLVIRLGNLWVFCFIRLSFLDSVYFAM